jgi:hypothetical protein
VGGAIMAASGQPEGRADKARIILVGVILVAIIIVVYTIITQGFGGIQNLIWTVVKWLLVAAVLGLIVFVVMKILSKPKVDLVAADMQSIIDAGVMSKPPMIKDLYFTGDKEHGEFRVGKICGYVQLQSYKDLNKIAGLEESEIKELKLKGVDPSHYIIKEDCLIFKRFGFPMSLFESPKVLRTLEDEHSQLIGDVKVYGVSMIKKFGYYWPNRGHLDIARIDHAVIKEAWRGQIHEFLKDMVAISQRSVGLDAEHRKEMENRKLLKLPSPLGESETRQ